MARCTFLPAPSVGSSHTVSAGSPQARTPTRSPSALRVTAGGSSRRFDQRSLDVDMGRDGIEPSTSGLKVVDPALSHTEPHNGALRNTLSLPTFPVVKCARLGMAGSVLELDSARNLHEIPSDFCVFLAFDPEPLSAISCTGYKSTTTHGRRRQRLLGCCVCTRSNRHCCCAIRKLRRAVLSATASGRRPVHVHDFIEAFAAKGAWRPPCSGPNNRGQPETCYAETKSS